MFSRPTELSTTWFNAFNESAFDVCQHKIKHCEPGQQVLETRLRHQSTYHIPTSEYPECLLHHVHPTKNSPTTELLFIPPSGVFFARNWSQSKHVTPSQMSKFLLLENISLSKARWASWCNPLQAGAFLFVGPKVLKRLHMWKIRVAGTNVYNLEVGRHISKVQKYRLLTTYYISLSLSLHRRLNESSRWLKASQGPKQEGTSHICLLAFFGNI